MDSVDHKTPDYIGQVRDNDIGQVAYFSVDERKKSGYDLLAQSQRNSFGTV